MRLEETAALPFFLVVTLPPAETTKVEQIPALDRQPAVMMEALSGTEPAAQAPVLPDAATAFTGKITPNDLGTQAVADPRDPLAHEAAARPQQQQGSGLELKKADIPENPTAIVRQPEQEELPDEPPAGGDKETIPLQPMEEFSGSARGRVDDPAPPAIEKESAAPEVEELQKKEPPKSRDISLQLKSANNERVEVRLADRLGEVRVTVRTADPQLKSGLQDNLSELAQRLDSSGFHAELWRPAEASFSSAHDGARHGGGDPESHGSRHGGQQQGGQQDGSQQQRREHPERNGQEASFYEQLSQSNKFTHNNER
jgi:hypothetical protein